MADKVFMTIDDKIIKDNVGKTIIIERAINDFKIIGEFITLDRQVIVIRRFTDNAKLYVERSAIDSFYFKEEKTK